MQEAESLPCALVLGSEMAVVTHRAGSSLFQGVLYS